MLDRKVRIEVICFISQHEDEDNLKEYIQDTLSEVVEGEVISVSIEDGDRDD